MNIAFAHTYILTHALTHAHEPYVIRRANKHLI